MSKTLDTPKNDVKEIDNFWSGDDKKFDQFEQYREKLGPMFDEITHLVQIASNGDPHKIRECLEDPQAFFTRSIKDTKGALQALMISKCLHHILTNESKKDPLEYMKFLKEMLDGENEIKPAGDGQRAPKEATPIEDGFLRRVEKSGDRDSKELSTGSGES